MKKILLFVAILGSLGASKCKPCPPGYDWYDGQGCVARPFPSPSPTPIPSPTPEPSPSPTPVPTPEPTPPPVQKCSVPVMPECGAPGPPEGPWGCCVKGGTGRYAEDVQVAVETARVVPSLVKDGKVIDVEGYLDFLVDFLTKAGYCVVKGGPEDEIGVKKSNAMNEQYDVILANMTAYSFIAATCTPARF